MSLEKLLWTLLKNVLIKDRAVKYKAGKPELYVKNDLRFLRTNLNFTWDMYCFEKQSLMDLNMNASSQVTQKILWVTF